jgi:hypothetical protein
MWNKDNEPNIESIYTPLRQRHCLCLVDAYVLQNESKGTRLGRTETEQSALVALLLVSMFMGSHICSQLGDDYGGLRCDSCCIQGILLWDMATIRVFAGLARRRRLSYVVAGSNGELCFLVSMMDTTFQL